MGTTTVLGQRALNRATLERQLLLRRSAMPVDRAVEHLCGLQAQTATSWYVGLWSRLERFDPRSVVDLLQARKLVRVVLMRSTIHLVSDRDLVAMRRPLQAVIVRSMRTNWGRRLPGVDVDEVTAAGRALLEAEPLTFGELGRRLQRRWPEHDAASLAQVVRAHAALVQVPPRGLWGRSGLALHTTAEHWLGRPLAPGEAPDELLLRYLGAFGPASVADARTWSGLTGLREVFERLRPGLRRFTDERGRELFDLPDAPRPDPGTPAPARFLYDYDNLLLSHDDRGRFLDAEHRRLLWPGDNRVAGAALLDGVVRGGWRLQRERDAATLLVQSPARLSEAATSALAEEGLRLLAFIGAGAGSHDVRFTVAD
jgi:Winged helix DNA-binding domain